MLKRKIRYYHTPESFFCWESNENTRADSSGLVNWSNVFLDNWNRSFPFIPFKFCASLLSSNERFSKKKTGNYYCEDIFFVANHRCTSSLDEFWLIVTIRPVRRWVNSCWNSSTGWEPYDKRQNRCFRYVRFVKTYDWIVYFDCWSVFSLLTMVTIDW